MAILSTCYVICPILLFKAQPRISLLQHRLIPETTFSPSSYPDPSPKVCLMYPNACAICTGFSAKRRVDVRLKSANKQKDVLWLDRTAFVSVGGSVSKQYSFFDQYIYSYTCRQSSEFASRMESLKPESTSNQGGVIIQRKEYQPQ